LILCLGESLFVSELLNTKTFPGFFFPVLVSFLIPSDSSMQFSRFWLELFPAFTFSSFWENSSAGLFW
jgi:hypothetical protein